MKTHKKIYGLVVALALVSPALGACSLHEKDHFSQNKVQVQEDKTVHEMPLSQLDRSDVEAIAGHYDRYGDGTAQVTMAYDPKSKSMGAMKASHELAHIIKDMRAAGVKDIQSNVLPVKDLAEPELIVSYASYEALAPKDCELMPGLTGRTIEAEESYKMGCTIDTIFAKQIARPKDLMGQETSGDTDGRRAANKVEGYRSGADNTPLGGESASGG